MSAADTADYEHWPDDATVTSAPSVVSGYNNANGLREYSYEPANADKDKDAPKEKKKVEVTTKPTAVQQAQPAQYAYQFPPQPQFQPQYMPSYPPMMQYACYPSPVAVPAPAYYGLPPPPQNGMAYGIPPGYVYSLAPAAATSKGGDTDGKNGGKDKETKGEKKGVKTDGKKDETEKEKTKSKKAEPLKWQGRTVAEVEEDNMKIAAKEGAYDARRVVPVGLEDDQIVWIILPDGTQSVRTWAEAKSMSGEWLEDPRFKNGWFLLCPQENKDDNKGKDKGEEKGEKSNAKKAKNKIEKRDKEKTGKEGQGDKEGNEANKADEEGKEEKKGCTCGGK